MWREAFSSQDISKSNEKLQKKWREGNTIHNGHSLFQMESGGSKMEKGRKTKGGVAKKAEAQCIFDHCPS